MVVEQRRGFPRLSEPWHVQLGLASCFGWFLEPTDPLAGSLSDCLRELRKVVLRFHAVSQWYNAKSQPPILLQSKKRFRSHL